VGPSLPRSYPYFTRISANLSKSSVTNHALWNKINTIIYYPTYGVPGSAFINGENREEFKEFKETSIAKCPKKIQLNITSD
jgi:hypothetical protein